MFRGRREWCCDLFHADWDRQDCAATWFEIRSGAIGSLPAQYYFAQVFAFFLDHGAVTFIPPDGEFMVGKRYIQCVNFCPYCGTELLYFYRSRITAMHAKQESRRNAELVSGSFSSFPKYPSNGRPEVRARRQGWWPELFAIAFGWSLLAALLWTAHHLAPGVWIIGIAPGGLVCLTVMLIAIGLAALTVIFSMSQLAVSRPFEKSERAEPF
jgi:hypothetical protein